MQFRQVLFNRCPRLALTLALCALASFAAPASAAVPAIPHLHQVEKEERSDQAYLHWTASGGATRYHVILIAYRYIPNTNSPVESTWVNDSTVTDTGYQAVNLAGSQYKWTVRAGNAEGWGAFASASTFDVYRDPVPVPLTDATVPELLLPYDGETIRSNTVELAWTLAVPGGDRFHYRLRRTRPVAETVSEGITSAYKAVVDGLISGSEYAWEVRAGDGTRWAPFAPARRFNYIEPLNPELISPRPDELFTGSGPDNFRWNRDPFATRYMFKLHRLAPSDSLFDVVYSTDPQVRVHLPADGSGAPSEAEYEWYVCSIRGAQGGACSPDRRFRTRPAPPVADSQGLQAAKQLAWEHHEPGNQWTYKYTYRHRYLIEKGTPGPGVISYGLLTEESTITAEIRNRSESGDSLFFQAGVNVRATDGRIYETMQERKYLLIGPPGNRSLFYWFADGNRWEAPNFSGSGSQYPVPDLLSGRLNGRPRRRWNGCGGDRRRRTSVSGPRDDVRFLAGR